MRKKMYNNELKNKTKYFSEFLNTIGLKLENLEKSLVAHASRSPIKPYLLPPLT